MKTIAKDSAGEQRTTVVVHKIASIPQILQGLGLKAIRKMTSCVTKADQVA